MIIGKRDAKSKFLAFCGHLENFCVSKHFVVPAEHGERFKEVPQKREEDLPKCHFKILDKKMSLTEGGALNYRSAKIGLILIHWPFEELFVFRF